MGKFMADLAKTGVTASLQGRNLISTIDNAREGGVGVGQPVIDLSGGTLSMISVNGGGEAVVATTIDGADCIQCTLSSGTYIAQIDLPAAVPLYKLRTLQIPIRFSSNYGFIDGTNPVQVWFYDTSLAKQWRAQLQISTLKANTWTTFSQRAGAATEGWLFAGGVTNTSDLDSVTVQRVRIVCAVPAGASGVTLAFGPITMNKRRLGCVSLVLDGEYPTQKSYIVPMLRGYGLRASFALTHSLIGTGGKMTVADLDELYQEGHEMIHHTYDAIKQNGYANATDWPTQQSIEDDIAAGQANLVANGWTRGLGYAVHGYSYPYDRTVAQARQDIVTAAYQAQNILAIRKSVPLYNRCQSWGDLVDPFVVQGALQVSSTDTSATIQAVIDAAESNGELAVITVHETVLDSATPTSLSIRNGDLNTALSYLATRVRAGGLRCLPFSEACEFYGLT